MNLSTLKILAESDPAVFADAIETFGIKVVGVKDNDPLNKRIQQESIVAMASVITEDVNDDAEFTPLQKAIKAIAEENGYIVSLCLECAQRKAANAKKRRK